MGKLTRQERELTKHIIAIMSMKRMSDAQIIAEIKRQINKELSRISLYHLRQQIKKDSYDWYMKLRSNQYEYLHKFKERVNEILSLQKMHPEIVESNKHNPQIQQTSLAELHKLNITFANYFDILPDVINGGSISTKISTKETVNEQEQQQSIFV